MYYLKTSAAFDSAHFLKGYDGKCSNIHGHHWVIEVMVSGEHLQSDGVESGMLMDFGDMKKIVRELADSMDHGLIYEENSLKPHTVEVLREEGFLLLPVGFRPTAENFARHFFDILSGKGLRVVSVTVYETPDNCAVCEV